MLTEERNSPRQKFGTLYKRFLDVNKSTCFPHVLFWLIVMALHLSTSPLPPAHLLPNMWDPAYALIPLMYLGLVWTQIENLSARLAKTLNHQTVLANWALLFTLCGTWIKNLMVPNLSFLIHTPVTAVRDETDAPQVFVWWVNFSPLFFLLLIAEGRWQDT